MRRMLITRAYRFAAQASLLARVYGGYKLIQALARAGLVEADGYYARHHRRSAEATYRLAVRLEGLPIKVCQFLGSRADILPAEYVDVLSALQDRVPPRPLAKLRPYLERELGAGLDDVFMEFDAAPLASASLSQVHRARLRDGREVAVKVQYPEIADVVAIDLENFAVLLGVLARLEPHLDLRVILNEVQKYVPLELDFCHEASNAERMAEHLAAHADVLVPAIVREWSTRRVLVMEYTPGVRVTDVAALRELGLDPADVARRLLELFCEQLLVHGFFHADPHPGNILVQPDGRLVLLDFGLVKDLPADFRAGIVRLVTAIVRGNAAAVADAFRALGFRTRDDGDDSLAWLGEASLGWVLRNGRAYADPEMLARFGTEMPQRLGKNPLVQIPADVLLVGRVMGLLSGIGKQLGSQADVGAILLPYLIGAA